VKEIVEILRVWEQHRAEPLALATLVRAQGSSYRRPGARMLIKADGATVGSLSGGCLEEEVAARAREVIRTGEPGLLSFDTRLRFGCNGTIDVLVERASDEFLLGLATQLRTRRSCYVQTTFAGEGRGSRLVPRFESTTADKFVQEIEPPIRLIIFGEGPDSSPLRTFAEVLGWEIIEVEQAAQLRDATDERTAAIIKSHNYGRDFAALQRLLQTELPYVGLLGPRRRRDQLLHALLDDGIEINAELFAPAGLDVGAETPEEIALAIVAEIQALFASASGERLRDRKAPIHGWNVVPAQRRLVTAALDKCAVSPR
jgi:xanthine/CO dehydrogenase XdhC/CoxF family maturation factor